MRASWRACSRHVRLFRALTRLYRVCSFPPPPRHQAQKSEAAGYKKRAEESAAAGVAPSQRPPAGGDPPPPGNWSWTLNWDYVLHKDDGSVEARPQNPI